MKLLLLDDWLKAIQKLIRSYNSGLSPSDIQCPLCRVSRMEKRNLADVDDILCHCPWMIFELDVESCYSSALRQSTEERIARLKDWQKRILRMKRRRKC